MFIEKAKAVHGDKYDYSKTVYTRSCDKVTVTCPKHGDFQVRAGNHLIGVGCAKCGFEKNAKEKAHTLDVFIEKAKAVHGDKHDYSQVEYINTDTKVTIVCKEHGAFQQTPYKHLKGQGCPICGVKKRAAGRVGKSINTAKPVQIRASNFVRNALLVHGKKYDYSQVKYINYQMPVRIVCPKHGVFEQSPSNHVAGKGCIKCTCNAISKPEQKIHDAFPEFKQSDRVTLNGKELDLLHGNVAVEVNGVHWHSDKYKPDGYHLYKTNLCANKGIQLLHFWDIEVENKFEIVQSMIASKLNKTKRIYARKCHIRDIDLQTANQFEQANHLQGSAISSVRYGLFQDDDLVAVMTFSKSRFNKKYDWELIRFCSTVGYTVVGGANKLFKHFLKNNSGSVISYANKRFSSGNLYAKLGFKLENSSSPNYWYVKDGVIVYSRNQCQKHKLPLLLGDQFDSGLSERENMRKAGYHRLYDCGNYVFIYDKRCKHK